MLEFIAEQKIAEAIARGELDALPGAGRPLDLDDDALIPEELRAANRILKNAGLTPPEVRKLDLMRARVERRYFGRVAARLRVKSAHRLG